MNQKKLIVLLIVIGLGAIVVYQSLFIVNEWEQAIITQFGQPMGGAFQQAGLHLKVPFVQKVVYFDKRLLSWDGDPTEVPTKDKKFIWVDATARWQINDPLKFLQTMGTENQAQSRLDDIIDGITRDLITSHSLIELVRMSDHILEVEKTEEDISSEERSDRIEHGREVITRQILEKAREIVKDYGIELIDVRIKRINYVRRVREKVYERMIAERRRVAEQLRSEGAGVRAEILGQKERELKRIQSEAYREAQKIKGEADAKSIKIYADAYSKDPEFYSFSNSLESYPTVLDKARFVLKTDAEFFKYLEDPGSARGGK